MERHFAHIVQQIRDKIKEYSDPQMHFRRQMIKNLHYLRNMSDEIVNELIGCLQAKRYGEGSDIIKSGDVSNRIHFIRKGEVFIIVSSKIGIEVTPDDEEIFDKLNTVRFRWEITMCV